MALSDLVSVSISAATKSPTKPGFGTPLIAAYHTEYVDRVRSYTSLAGMVSDGFATTDPAYLAASKIFAANPSVKRLKIGRRALPMTQTLRLTCLDATEGTVYSFTLAGTAISYTVLAAATTTTVATAIELLTEAVTGVTSSSSGAAITITATAGAGALLDLKDWDVNLLKVEDITADPGIATDLAAIALADNDWYGLALDSNSEAEIAAAALWAEANKKLFATNNSDSTILDSGVTNDVLSDLQDASYARTFFLYSGRQLLSYSGAAMLGNRLPDNPGSDTWMYKTLPGVFVDNLTDTQESNIRAKGGNVYTTVAGINMVQRGISPSGEFIDTTRFIDWLTAEIQIRVFAALANAKKIPYTDAGVDIVRCAILGALRQGVARGGLAASPAPDVQAPLVADVSDTDRANRNLPDVTFSARLAGAVHTLEIAGTLTV